MSKQIMDIDVLHELIANTFGTSQVLVEKNNRILTIEPVSTKNPVSSLKIRGQHTECQEKGIDKTKAGALTLEDFADIRISTKNFKFNRDEANERR
jgi:hypothetical protein